MPHRFQRKKLSYLIHTALASTLVMPAMAQAQDDDIEEVVVTGSYLRNSAFAQDTAVDTVTNQDLVDSGTPNFAQYIRDLSYVQNVDVVAVVLGGQDGPQTSNGASFNLRGLGENSTLTLVDGTRVVDSRLNTTIPQIAMERMELVLDGGSATYGADAVAGVVNLIPIKEFDGFRFRSYYQRPEDGANEEMRFSTLWGRSFDNGLNYVGAFETYLRTPLMWYERGREHSVSQGSSSSGNPGTFKEVVGADPNWVPGMPHGGTLTGPRMVDEGCGTYNDGAPEHGYGPNPLPSGTVHPSGFCTFEYSAQAEILNHTQEYNLYNNLEWQATDWLTFGGQLQNYLQHQNGRGTFASPNPNNNRRLLLVPAEHPANPYGYDVAPDLWRIYTHQPQNQYPEGVNDDSSRSFRSIDQVNKAKLYANYDISDTWSGYTYYSKQEFINRGDASGVRTSRLQLALRGMGGPNGDQWFNPFSSGDPRSPFWEPGLENTKAVNDWMAYRNENHRYQHNYLDIFETVVSGEAFDVPAGTVQVAFGYQWRDFEENTFQEPFDGSGENFIWGIYGEPVAPDEEFFSAVRSVFAEVEVPILDNLAIKGAVRHEEFTDQGLDATVPKISARYEVIPDLALRASWGESFLAPTSFQTRPARTNENCQDMYSGVDDLTGTLLLGGLRCASGNPNLGPEVAEIANLGFTWSPSGGAWDGFEFSLDYQQIDYTDRIRTLSEDDVTRNQFTAMLAATGQTEASYDPTPGSASRIKANEWLGQFGPGGASGNIFRRPDGSVDLVLIQSANVAEFDVELFDIKASYDYQTDNYGTLSTRLQATIYDNYVFTDKDGSKRDVLGEQNARTNIAPPMPEVKLAWNNNWFMNNHSASLSLTWFSDVNHDAQVVDLYPYDGVFQPPSEISEDPIVDVRYTYLFDDFFGSEITATVGINNLFDYEPTLTGQIGGFESRLINNFYRQFWVSIDWTPGG
jgi:outer membrane receptor protein involved in Fe transport